MTAIWGTSFPLMRCLNLQIDHHFDGDLETSRIAFRTIAATWIIGLRCTIACAMFLVFFRQATRRVRRAHVLAGAAIGLMFFCGLVFQVIGLATLPASRSGFLTSLVVIIVPLISTVVNRRLPSLIVLFAGAIALVGAAILTGLIDLVGDQAMLADEAFGHWTVGDSLTILGAFFFSLQVVLVDWFGKRYSSIEFTPSMFATMAVCAWLLFAGMLASNQADSLGRAEQWLSIGTSPSFIGLIGVLALFPSLIAFALMNKYQPKISPTHAGVIYTLEPVFASLMAMFLPALLSRIAAVQYENERFTVPLLIGGLLVVAANALASKSAR